MIYTVVLSLPDEIILIVGEPNNNNNEDCLALLHEQSNDNWNDQGCDKTQHGFICMKPGSFSSIMR